MDVSVDRGKVAWGHLKSWAK